MFKVQAQKGANSTNAERLVVSRPREKETSCPHIKGRKKKKTSFLK